jgi:hypothetical protein
MRNTKFKIQTGLFTSLRRNYGLILLTLSVLFTACDPPATVDQPASALDVKITVIDVTENPSDGKVPVVMQFFLNGKYVKLAAGVSVTCNGVALTDNGIGSAERVPLLSPGNQYVFRHVRNGTTTVVNVTASPRPVINAPAQNATVTRSSSLTINYVAGTGTGIRGGGSDPSTGLSGTVQADNGTYTGLNVSSLKAGPGTISITRESKNNMSTGFKSTEINYSSGKSHNVTWN